MPLYRATIAGHKPVLISGPSAAKALASFVELAPMKSEEIITAMENGERAFKDGDKIELLDKPDTTSQTITEKEPDPNPVKSSGKTPPPPHDAGEKGSE